MANTATTQLIIDFTDNTGPGLSKFATNVDAVFAKVQANSTAAVNSMQKSLNSAMSHFASVGTSFNQVASGNLKSIQSIAQAMSSQFQKTLQGFTTGLQKSVGSSLNNLQSGMAATTRNISGNLQNATSAWSGTLSKLNQSTSQAAQGIKQSTGSIASDFVRAAKVSLTFQLVQSAIHAVTGAISTMATEVIDFDLALREVATISPEVANNFDAIRRNIIGINPALGTTTELTKALYETYSSGIVQGKGAAEAIAFTGEAAKLAKAGLTDNATAVRVLSSSLNAFGRDSKHAGEFADILFKAVEQGQFRFTDLANAIGPVLPIASQLGLTMNEAATAIATLSQGGFSASEATTALRSVLTNVVQHLDQFKAAGIDALGILAGPNGFVKLMEAMRTATGGNVEALRNLIPDMRGTAGALALTGSQFEKLKINMDESVKSAGSVDRAFKEIKASTSEAFKDLFSSFERLAQVSSAEPLKVTGDVARGLGQAMQWMTERWEYFRVFAIGPFSAALYSVLGVFNLAMAGVKKFAAVALGAAADILHFIPGLGKTEDALRSMATSLHKGAAESFESSKQYGAAIGQLVMDGAKLVSGQFEQEKQQEKLRLSNEKLAEETKKLAFDGYSALSGKAQEASVKSQAFGSAVTSSGKAAATSAEGVSSASASSSEYAATSGLARQSASKSAEQFAALSSATSNYTSALNTSIAQVVKTAAVNEGHRASLTNLGISFSAVFAQGLKYEEQLRKLGATSEFLNSKTAQVTPTMIAAGAALGMTASQVTELVTNFRDAQAVSSILGTQLQQNGADAGILASRIINLNAELKSAADPSLKLKLALDGLGLSLPPDLSNRVTMLKTALDAGSISGEKARDIAEKIREEYVKLGQAVPAELQKIIDKSVSLDHASMTVDRSLKSVGAFTAETAKTEIGDLIARFSTLATQGGASAGFIQEAWTSAVSKMRDQFGGVLPPALAALDAKIRGLKNAFQTVHEAAQVFGTVTTTESAKTAENMKLAFDKMRLSGDFTFAQLKSAFAKTIEAMKASGQKLPADWEQTMVQLTELTRREVQKMGATLEELGTKHAVRMKGDVKRELEQTAEELVRLRGTGQAVSSDIVKAWETMVTKAKDAGLKLTPAMQEEFEKVKKAAALAGSQAGTMLGDGMVQASKGSVAALDAQLAKLSGNMKTTFGTDLVTIMNQIKDFREKINALGGTDPLGMKGYAEAQRKEWQKALDMLNAKMLPAFNDLLGTAKAIFEATGKIVLPPGLGDAAKALGLSMKELEDAIRGAADAGDEGFNKIAEGANKAKDAVDKLTESTKKAKDVAKGVGGGGAGSGGGDSGGNGGDNGGSGGGGNADTLSGTELLNGIKAMRDTIANWVTTRLRDRSADAESVNSIFQNLSERLYTIQRDNSLSASQKEAQSRAIILPAFLQLTALFSELRDLFHSRDPSRVPPAGSQANTAPAPRTGAAGTNSRNPSTGTAQQLSQSMQQSTRATNSLASTITAASERRTASVAASEAVVENVVATATPASVVVTPAATQLAPTSNAGSGFVPQTGATYYSPPIRAERSRSSALIYNVGPSTIRVDETLEQAGFQQVRGMGIVPTMKMAAATGRTEDLLGPGGQRRMQREIIPLVRDSINKRDLTTSIQRATAINRKGTPVTKG